MKLDGYRAIIIKQGNEARVYSRNGSELKDLGSLYSALLDLPAKSCILDGELVVLDEEGKPAFTLLQNRRRHKKPVIFYAFDVLHCDGEDLVNMTLKARRQFLDKTFRRLPAQVKISPILKGSRALVMEKIRELGLEGIVAKRRDSLYEPGKRIGAWQKHKIQRTADFVIGGYIGRAEELVVGEKRDGQWHFVASVKNGLVPATRAKVYAAIKDLQTTECPYVNLPEKRGGHMDREKMEKVRWVKPRLVVEVAFNESGRQAGICAIRGLLDCDR